MKNEKLHLSPFKVNLRRTCMLWAEWTSSACRWKNTEWSIWLVMDKHNTDIKHNRTPDTTRGSEDTVTPESIDVFSPDKINSTQTSVTTPSKRDSSHKTRWMMSPCWDTKLWHIRSRTVSILMTPDFTQFKKFSNKLQLVLPGLWSTGMTKSQLQIIARNNYIHTYIGCWFKTKKCQNNLTTGSRNKNALKPSLSNRKTRPTVEKWNPLSCLSCVGCVCNITALRSEPSSGKEA